VAEGAWALRQQRGDHSSGERPSWPWPILSRTPFQTVEHRFEQEFDRSAVELADPLILGELDPDPHVLFGAATAAFAPAALGVCAFSGI
jgi:hypothetical protein